MSAIVGRREVIAALGGAAAAWPLAARAQQPDRMRQVGVIVGLAEDDPEAKARFAGFRQAFEKLGWSEGRNVRFNYRYAPAGARVQTLARELIALQPEVILAQGTPISAALKQETSTIPVVFVGRSGRLRVRRQLGATRRKSHRLYELGGEHHRQVAGDAQGDRAKPQARCVGV
jgi:ABC-type uncharacterized transport system substrate-binding protein